MLKKTYHKRWAISFETSPENLQKLAHRIYNQKSFQFLFFRLRRRGGFNCYKPLKPCERNKWAVAVNIYELEGECYCIEFMRWDKATIRIYPNRLLTYDEQKSIL